MRAAVLAALILWTVVAGALFRGAARRHGARADGVQASLAREFAVVRRLAAEQGVLLSNQSSAGSETSAGAAQQSSDQHSKRLDLNDAFRSSTQPGSVAHASCRLAEAFTRVA